MQAEFVWLKGVMWEKPRQQRGRDGREQPGWAGRAHSLGPKVAYVCMHAPCGL